jgi:hypothetical protein
VALVLAAVALAAPPANDDRGSPQAIELGDRVRGTTSEATREETDPSSECASGGGNVWYQFDAPRDGRIIAALEAEGDLDATVDIYLRERSQLTFVNCDASDRRGAAAADFRVERGESYLIAVSQLANSEPGDFTLELGLAGPAARAPGRSLPSRGGTGTVQRVFQPSDASSTRLSEGTTYRINLSSFGGSCMQLSIFAPDENDFESDDPVAFGRCGYAVFTPGPGEGGRYSFLVEPSPGSRGVQRYHIQAARAGGDDTTPGRFIRNHARVRGRLNATGVDVIDLYRFDVTNTSRTELGVNSIGGDDIDLILLSESGRRIRCACDEDSDPEIAIRTRRGRYYAAVVAGNGRTKGSYTLSRASKLLTRTRLSVNGRRSATVSPGRSVRRVAGVSPRSGGPVEIVVERFDPLEGWQFLRSFRLRARGGRAAASMRPPSEGSYRARAVFKGTRQAARSTSGLARFKVRSPLRSKR